MSTYSNAQEISQKVLDGLTVYSDLLGPRDESKKGKYGGTAPGLNMDTHCATLEQQKEKLMEGVFQVLFTGGFSAGKSTLLNALMRTDVLRMSINAETAIITKIVFEKEEKIIVHLKEVDKVSGKPLKKEMSLKEFFEAYRVDQEDPDKFKKVDYALLQMNQAGIGGSMVQLVDSPGTQNSDADTKAARDFAKSADAIVYLINATQPFQQEDKAYIARNYAGKHMENLFFVVNRFDCVAESDIPALKQNVREQLSAVFTKADGTFNEVLFNSRVFYTNAYGALMTRLGKPIKMMGMEVKIPEEATGVPQFEEALGRFLTDGGRDRKAFQAYLPKMAGMYLAADEKITSIMKVYQENEDALVAKKEKVESSRNEYVEIENQIKDSCRTAVAGILMDAKDEYNRCVTRIDSGWDKHFASSNVEIKFTQMMGLAFDKVTGIFSNDEAAKQLKMEKRMQPLTDAVNGYIAPELKKIEPGLTKAIEVRLNTLKNQLDLCAKRLDNLDSPLSFDDIAKNLMGAYHMDTSIAGGAKVDANLFQIIMGAIALDPETIGKGVGGKTSNASAIVSTITKTIVEFVALYVVGWPIGLAMLAARLVQMIKEGKATRKSTASQILSEMRGTAVAELRKNERNFVMELENRLSVITRGGVTMADSIEQQVDSYVTQIDDAISDLNTNENAKIEEELRTNNIKTRLRETLKSLYALLNGTVLTDDRIKDLAVAVEQ